MESSGPQGLDAPARRAGRGGCSDRAALTIAALAPRDDVAGRLVVFWSAINSMGAIRGRRRPDWASASRARTLHPSEALQEPHDTHRSSRGRVEWDAVSTLAPERGSASLRGWCALTVLARVGGIRS